MVVAVGCGGSAVITGPYQSDGFDRALSLTTTLSLTTAMDSVKEHTNGRVASIPVPHETTYVEVPRIELYLWSEVVLYFSGSHEIKKPHTI